MLDSCKFQGFVAKFSRYLPLSAPRPAVRRSTGWSPASASRYGRWPRHQGVAAGEPPVEPTPAPPLLGARAPRDTHVAVDVVLGDALLKELVGLGFGVAAGGSLDALPAGPDIAVSLHARTIPLCDGLAQWGSVSNVTVMQRRV